MTPLELKTRLDNENPPLVLDVREAEEYAIANLGGTHIPLSELANRYQELDPQKEMVVMCHHGVRSAHAIGFLRQHGFANLSNLSGGIDLWSVQVDPNVPRY